jgi:hypothetical protein
MYGDMIHGRPHISNLDDVLTIVRQERIRGVMHDCVPEFSRNDGERLWETFRNVRSHPSLEDKKEKEKN